MVTALRLLSEYLCVLCCLELKIITYVPFRLTFESEMSTHLTSSLKVSLILSSNKSEKNKS